MATCAQMAPHVPAAMTASFVQGSRSLHAAAVGQAPGAPSASAVSQVSPRSTTPFPQVGEQSASSAFVAPLGQHLSPETRAFTSW